MSTSSNTNMALLPPSSMLVGRRLVAAATFTRRPVSTLPVNATCVPRHTCRVDAADCPTRCQRLHALSQPERVTGRVATIHMSLFTAACTYLGMPA